MMGVQTNKNIFLMSTDHPVAGFLGMEKISLKSADHYESLSRSCVPVFE
jgi:hypothetical protein